MIPERDAVRRLVHRVGMGPRPGELAAAEAAGFEATLARLTAPDGPDAGAVATPAPNLGAPEPRLGKRADQRQRQAQRRAELDESARLGHWWLDRMAAADRPFRERMTWFWHGHFATSARKVRSAELMYAQNDTLRRLGLGDFRALARAMVVDPAMLVWLDGGGNKVGRPNENLAREFMELFTLGVDRYTEADVKDAARALTGWRVDYTAGTAVNAARAHDTGRKTVLGTTADLDAPGLVDVLVGQPVSAEFLAGRVWTRFVSHTPPDAAALGRLAAAYGPGHDATALLRAAVREPAFRDPGSVLVKEPVLWLTSALRALRIQASAIAPTTLTAGLTALGQVPLAPPDVGGWPSGLPWLTTAAAGARLELGQALAAAGDLGPVASVAPERRVDATAALLGLPGFGDRTAAALRPLAGDPRQLVALALAGPEYTVCG